MVIAGIITGTVTWFEEASYQEIFYSLVFFILYQTFVFYGIFYFFTYISAKSPTWKNQPVPKELVLKKYEAFEAGIDFSWFLSIIFCIPGIIFLFFLGWEDLELTSHGMIIYGFFIFLLIGTIVYTYFQTSDYIPNPYKDEAEPIIEKKGKEEALRLEKKEKEDEIKYGTSNLIGYKEKYTDYLEESKKDLDKISEMAPILKRKISEKGKYLRKFIKTYFDIPKCKKCFADYLYLFDIINNGNVIHLHCKTCQKQFYLPSNHDEVIDGDKHFKYMEEYWELLNEGYKYYREWLGIEDECTELWDDYCSETEDTSFFQEIIDKDKSLDPDYFKSHKQLDKTIKQLDKTSDSTITFMWDDNYDPPLSNFIRLKSTEEKVENKSNKKGKRERMSQDILDKVWNRDGGKCVKCGSNEKLEFDHMIPVSKGGANTYRNIQLLCEPCNRKKSAKIG